jgi:hypothetical protein
MFLQSISETEDKSLCKACGNAPPGRFQGELIRHWWSPGRKRCHWPAKPEMLEGVIRMADMTAGDVMVAAPHRWTC